MNTLEIISQTLSQQKKDIDLLEKKIKTAQQNIVGQAEFVIQQGIKAVEVATKLPNSPIVTFDSNNITLEPNRYYRMTGTTSMSALTITFATPTDTTICNEYFVEFPCNYSNMSLSVPAGVKWANGLQPKMNNGSIYQMSFINNLGVYTEFK